jgi:hypothetical protein
MILVLYYEGESKDSQEALLKDAANIKKKIDKSGKLPQGKETRILTETEFQAYMDSEASKWETKIHVVAHGNQQVVGHFNGQGLGEFLEPSLQKRQNITKITLHSCNARAFHPEHYMDFNYVLAYQLASYLNGKLPKSRFIEIRGSVGESYTDSEGRNWVLDQGQELPKEKPANVDREKQMIKEIMRQDRATARPIFALQNGQILAAQRKDKQLVFKGIVVGGKYTSYNSM